MIASVLCIAKDEWRYWYRSRLAISVLLLTVIISLASVIITAVNMDNLNQQRESLQRAAEQSFVDQPNRHPHRMIHFGHYVFRTPPPLGNIDPGVDSYTGTAMFLEGHRQNGSTFSPQQQSSGLAWLGSFSPANVLQIIAPLLLILIGFSVVTREKEAGTFTFLKVQGTSSLTLLTGKGLAVFSAAVVIMLPLIIGCMYSITKGAELSAALVFVAGYALYLAFWCMLVLFVSSLSKSNRASLILLICCWVTLALILPRVASNSATVFVNSPGKIETDFAVLKNLREQADGHNANDPAFNELRASLLEKYNVDRVEDLPVNFKGVVAKRSEAKLTDTLNFFAEKRMKESQAQAEIARTFGWLSPTIAIQTLSMKIAGTDLENYHRFLKAAESVRFGFVQSLNELHAHEITYDDDVNKYNNESRREKAKVSAANWDILNDFHFTAASSEQRLSSGSRAMMQLLFLLAFMSLTVFIVGRRV